MSEPIYVRSGLVVHVARACGRRSTKSFRDTKILSLNMVKDLNKLTTDKNGMRFS